jgi:hypothetical protein
VCTSEEVAKEYAVQIPSVQLFKKEPGYKIFDMPLDQIGLKPSYSVPLSPADYKTMSEYQISAAENAWSAMGQKLSHLLTSALTDPEFPAFGRDEVVGNGVDADWSKEFDYGGQVDSDGASDYEVIR